MKMEYKIGLLSFVCLVAGVESQDSSKANATGMYNDTTKAVNRANYTSFENQNSTILVQEQQRLIAHLFKNYDNNVRPVSDPGKNLSVEIVPVIRQIVQVNERQQVLTLYFWLRLLWYDKNFQWDKNNFSNITKVNVEPDTLWVPDIALINSAQEGQDALIYRKMTTKVQVHNDGLCKWLSPYFSSTSCNIDSTDFPFDQQTCIVEMASWTQTGLQIDVNLGSVSIDTGSYQENIQWKLVSTDARKEVKYYTFTTEPYPSVVFEFVLRRRSLYYIINLIFPCVILSFLSLMTFYIPPASGERVTLSISLLLTMLFTLYIVTENLPPDSTTVPLLTKFVGVAMLVMTLSLFATSVGIKFEGKAEKMPKWMCLLVNKYLACLVLYDRSCLHDCTSPGGRSKGEAVFRRNSHEDYQETLLQGHGELEVSTAHRPKPQIIPDPNNQQTCRYRITETSRNRDAQESQPAEAGGPGRHDLILTDIANKFRRLSSRVQKKNAEEELEDEWKKAGVILNKFFFWTFLGVLLFSTIAIFSRAKYTE